MHIGTWFILSGLLIELLGVLFLSIDAIGIERVRNASASLLWFRKFIVSKHPTNTFLSPARFYVGIIGPLGGTVTLLVASHPPNLIAGLPFVLFAIIVLVAGALFTAFLVIAIPGTIFLLARFLAYLDASTERKTAGIVGFSVLAVGICLQFAGTVIDTVNRI
jgi:hypothetical protein